MGFVSEFKQFINQGNAMDLAIGVVIGAAFQNIVNSIVNDLIMPIVGLLTGGIDFSKKYIALGSDPDAPHLNYGNVITALINFLIIAMVIFIIVKGLNKARKKEEEKA